MNEPANKPLGLKKRALSLKQKSQHNFSLGQRGEDQAAQFLETQGYQILDRNVSFKAREIDLVALDRVQNELVFVEVKTRSQAQFGHPSQAVTRHKQRSIQHAAIGYLRHQKLYLDFRFDIVTLTSGKIEHYQNVTWP